MIGVPTKPAAIVTASYTVTDGLVLRWYQDLYQAENGIQCLSASRNGVRVYGYLHHVPAGWILDAGAAFGVLERRDEETAERLTAQFVTHTRPTLMGKLMEVHHHHVRPEPDRPAGTADPTPDRDSNRENG